MYKIRCVSSRYVFVGTSAKLLHLKVTMESEVIAGVGQRCFDPLQLSAVFSEICLQFSRIRHL